jgi:hypothetical protein
MSVSYHRLRFRFLGLGSSSFLTATIRRVRSVIFSSGVLPVVLGGSGGFILIPLMLYGYGISATN